VSAFTESHYTINRVSRYCAACGAYIPHRAWHLVWKPEKETTLRICEPCSLKTNADGTLVYDCQDTVNESCRRRRPGRQ
jgi:hypothetical protein